MDRIECTECHRPLKSAKSREAHIGPRCAAIKAALDALSDNQRTKVRELLDDRALTRVHRTKPLFKVISSSNDTVYTACLTGQCNCMWGLKRTSATTKVCAHVAAARIRSGLTAAA